MSFGVKKTPPPILPTQASRPQNREPGPGSRPGVTRRPACACGPGPTNRSVAPRPRPPVRLEFKPEPQQPRLAVPTHNPSRFSKEDARGPVPTAAVAARPSPRSEAAAAAEQRAELAEDAQRPPF